MNASSKFLDSLTKVSEYRRMTLRIVVLKPEIAHAYGATLGEEHIASANSRIRIAIQEDTLLLLDLSDVLSITPSYLKATLLWALECGRTEAQQKSSLKKTRLGSEPLKLFPAVSGCSLDVASDIHEFFAGRGLPILHITKRRADRLLAAQVFGSLDPLLFRTLDALVEKRTATAAELAEQSAESISVNGWNNRLADLHLLRLVTRRREGKFWIYAPVAERITLWG